MEAELPDQKNLDVLQKTAAPDEAIAPTEGAAKPLLRPALSLALKVNGELRSADIEGFEDLEHAVPTGPRSRFLLGSVSKQFTAFAALLENQAGRLDLDADIRTYLPEFPIRDQRVAVRDLIHHTSGLRDQVELMALSGTPLNGEIRHSAALAMVMNQRALNFEPGTDFRYSNSNYTVLAEIVGRVSGLGFRRALRQGVFEPLGMSHTDVDDSGREVWPGRVSGYSPGENGAYTREPLNYGIMGTTGVWSTAEDMLIWLNEILEPRTFAPALVDAFRGVGHLADGTPLSYGFGLVTGRIEGHRAIFHAGADPGFQAFAAVLPDARAAVVALSAGVDDAAGLAARLVVDHFGAAEAPAAGSVDAGFVRRVAGDYVNGWDPSLTLVDRDGRLFVEKWGRSLEAAFDGAGGFYFGSPAQTFRLRPDGGLAAVSGLSGLDTVYRRVNRRQAGPDADGDHVGRYRSDELDVTYWFERDPPGLRLRSLRSPEVSLEPADVDAFETRTLRYPELRLEFHRDAEGRVDGFHLASGRVRGLWFQKQDGDAVG